MNDFGFTLGWGIKIMFALIAIGGIGKLVLISVNKHKMKNLEDKISKHKSGLIIFFFPALFVAFTVAMSLSFYADGLIEGADRQAEREAPKVDEGEVDNLERVQQELSCSLLFSSSSCDN